MTTPDSSTNQLFWAEIESLGQPTTGDTAGRDASALDLARRVARDVRGFEKIKLLEALLAKSSDVALFSAVWAAHFNLGADELQSAGMLRKDGGGALRLEVPPDDPLALLASGRLLVREGRFDDALRVFQRGGALRPDDVFAATWMATTLATLGRHDEADELFAAIGRRVPWPCAITRLSKSFWHELGARIDAIERENKPELSALAALGSPVTLVSCDRRYFLRYGEAYVRAWAAHGPRDAGEAAWRLHMHVIGPDDECRKRIAAWRESYAGIWVTTID